MPINGSNNSSGGAGKSRGACLMGPLVSPFCGDLQSQKEQERERSKKIHAENASNDTLLTKTPLFGYNFFIRKRHA